MRKGVLGFICAHCACAHATFPIASCGDWFMSWLPGLHADADEMLLTRVKIRHAKQLTWHASSFLGVDYMR